MFNLLSCSHFVKTVQPKISAKKYSRDSETVSLERPSRAAFSDSSRGVE